MGDRVEPGRQGLPPVAIEAAVAGIVALHATYGGATFSLYHGDRSRAPLYAVSLFPERGVALVGRHLPPGRLRAFIVDNLAHLRDPRHCVGTWYNPEDGLTYLDVSATVASREQALGLARRHNQVSIFSLASFTSVHASG